MLSAKEKVKEGKKERMRIGRMVEENGCVCVCVCVCERNRETQSGRSIRSSSLEQVAHFTGITFFFSEKEKNCVTLFNLVSWISM